MEKYKLVKEITGAGEEFLEPTTEYDIRITQQGKPRMYISHAMSLFENGNKTIVLKAMGRAINKAVTTAEILKRKLPLHQWTLIDSIEIIDTYEPLEEGLDVVISKRFVSCMKITLSTTKDNNLENIIHNNTNNANDKQSSSSSSNNNNNNNDNTKKESITKATTSTTTTNDECCYTSMGHYQPPLPPEQIQQTGDDFHQHHPK